MESIRKAENVEKILNDCCSATTHLMHLNNEFPSKNFLKPFFYACILYWSESQYYDERNAHAVLESREIAKHCPELKKIHLNDDILKNAFFFTNYAHRYLQNQLFKTILKFLEQEGDNDIYSWYKSQEFIIYGDRAIPYENWKKGRV